MPSDKRAKPSKAVKHLLKLPSNAICADCDSKFIKSADVVFAVFLCRECGEGHVKKVPGCKVVATNAVWNDDWVQLMKSVGGNSKINQEQYESNIHKYDGRKRPTSSTRFIYDKYKWRFFCHDKKWMPVKSGAAASDSSSEEEVRHKKKKDKKKKKKHHKQAVPVAIQAPPQVQQQRVQQVQPVQQVQQTTAFSGNDDWGFTSNPAPVSAPVPASAPDDWGFSSVPQSKVQQPIHNTTGAPVDALLTQMTAPTRSVTEEFSALDLFDPGFSQQPQPAQTSSGNVDIMAMFDSKGQAQPQQQNNGMGMSAFGGARNMPMRDLGMGQSANRAMGQSQRSMQGNRGMNGMNYNNGMNRGNMGMGMNNMNNMNTMNNMQRGNMGMGMGNNMQRGNMGMGNNMGNNMGNMGNNMGNNRSNMGSNNFFL